MNVSYALIGEITNHYLSELLFSLNLVLFFLLFTSRVNGKLVALKVIRLQEEEGTPFTAIREGTFASVMIALGSPPSCNCIFSAS